MSKFQAERMNTIQLIYHIHRNIIFIYFYNYLFTNHKSFKLTNIVFVLLRSGIGVRRITILPAQ